MNEQQNVSIVPSKTKIVSGYEKSKVEDEISSLVDNGYELRGFTFEKGQYHVLMILPPSIDPKEFDRIFDEEEVL